MNPFSSIFKEIAPKEVSSTVENLAESVSDFNPTDSLPNAEKQAIASYLHQAVSWIVAAVLFLVPLAVWPLGADWFEMPKNSLLFLGSAVAVVLWFGSSLLSKKWSIPRSQMDFPILAFIGAIVASAFFSTNLFSSLLSDPISLGGGALLFFAIGFASTKESVWQKLVHALILSAGILGIVSVLQYVAVLVANIGKITIPFVFANPVVSLAGSPLSQAIFLAGILPLSVGMLMKKGKKLSTAQFLSLSGVATVFNFVGLILSVYTLYQSNPALLDLNTGWRVATGSLDTLRTTLLGVSPGHYVDAFTARYPIEFNNTIVWNSRFATSSNFFLYVLTTAGILGLAGFVWMTLRFAITAKSRLATKNSNPLEKGLLASAGVLFVSFLFLPAPTVATTALFAVLGLLAAFYREESITNLAWNTDRSNVAPIARTLATVVTIVLTGAVGYYLVNAQLADYYFANSLKAAQANKGTDTYNLQIKAVSTAPWNDNYRLAYSQTNLALADSLAAQPNLTDDQKQTVVQLVQQAIREARIAATLEPNRSANWENLSFIYRNLINFAQGADQWSVAAQNQAIALNPMQPRLRLDLGGLYFAAKDYQSAAQIFAQAVNLKPNYANAHYNLAQALKNLNLKEQALAQLQLTGALVCSGNTNSVDCQRVNDEIKSLGSEPASPAAVTAPAKEAQPIGTSSGQNSNLEKAKTQPPVKISSPSGEISR